MILRILPNICGCDRYGSSIVVRLECLQCFEVSVSPVSVSYGGLEALLHLLGHKHFKEGREARIHLHRGRDEQIHGIRRLGIYPESIGNESLSTGKRTNVRHPSESKPLFETARIASFANTTSRFQNDLLRDDYLQYFTDDPSPSHPICLDTLESDECRVDEVPPEGDHAPGTLSAGTSL